MTKEQLRMQMLAGIITESQYKEEIEELDSVGKIGKSYPAPSTPEPIKKGPIGQGLGNNSKSGGSKNYQ